MGNNVLKVLLGGSGEEDTGQDITLEGSKNPVFRLVRDESTERGLIKVCEEFGADLVHAHILNARYPRVILKSIKKLGIPLVITIHSWSYLCPIHFYVQLPDLKPCNITPLKRRCLRCIVSKSELDSIYPYGIPWMIHGTLALRRLLREADRALCPSKLFATTIKEKLGFKVRPIPHPFEPKVSYENPEFEGEGSLLFIGRLEFEKGAHLIPQLAEILEGIEINVIGKGSFEERFSVSTLSN
ncbi:MAG: glycosyltransferase, partial [Thermoproteota archaeon]